MKSTWSFDSTTSLAVEHSSGPLTIGGHGQHNFLVTATSEPEFSMSEAEKALFRFSGPSTLRVPDGIDITVGEVAGPLTLDGIRANANIGDVRGPTRIADVEGSLACTGSLFGPVRIGDAGKVSLHRRLGPLSASDIGSIELNESSGPVRVRRCSGSLHATSVVGSGTFSDISGNVQVDWLAENLRLTGLLHGQNVWRATVQGSATISLDKGSSANIKLITKSGDIATKGLELDNSVHNDGLFKATIGDGEATLEIEADGDIVLRQDTGLPEGDFGLPFSTEEIGEGVENMVGALESGIRNLGEEVSQSLRLEEDIRDLGGRIRERVQRDVDRFMKRQGRRV
ncbi:MAG: hypothetical protein QF609_00295 [Gammaproteobacteria bacterium]|nr:hypothetical protein [Gammaproteobacteria bacterium]